MANKGNTGLAIDREAVTSYYTYVDCMRKRLDSLIPTARNAVKYLSDEQNVNGGDTEATVSSLKELEGLLDDMGTRITNLTKAVKTICDRYGDTSVKHNKNLADAKAEMGKAIAHMKQTGR